MSSMEGLGKDFNLANSVTGSGVRVNLQNAIGVTFVVVGAAAATPIAINESNAPSGGVSQALNAVTRYYQSAGTSGTWTKVTQVASNAATAVVTPGLISVYVGAVQLSDGFYYISATHATGTIVYILHGLETQRDPRNLRSVTA